MNVRSILKYVVLPLVGLLVLIGIVFHRPIARKMLFDHYFSRLIASHGRHASLDYAEAVLSLGPPAEERLANVARAPRSKPLERRMALYLLGRLGQETSLPLLCEATTDPLADVRLGAVLGLRHMMRCELVPVVEPLTRDPADSVRRWAVMALGEVGCPEAVALLKGLVQTERVQAIWFQAWLGLRRQLPVDGVVAETFRINRNLQLVPADEENIEMPHTYFFIRVRGADGAEEVTNVPFTLYRQIRVGDTIRKPAGAEEFELHPAPGGRP